MPIREHRTRDTSTCACCGNITRASTGIVVTERNDPVTYFAQWTPGGADHGIALLVGMGDPRGFVAARYEMQSNAIIVIGPDDYNWHKENVKIMRREEVIGTPLAAETFRIIDEIWIHDPEIRAFVTAHTIAESDSEE